MPVRLSTYMVISPPRSVDVEPGAVDVLDLRADGHRHLQVTDLDDTPLTTSHPWLQRSNPGHKRASPTCSSPSAAQTTPGHGVAPRGRPRERSPRRGAFTPPCSTGRRVRRAVPGR